MEKKPILALRKESKDKKRILELILHGPPSVDCSSMFFSAYRTPNLDHNTYAAIINSENIDILIPNICEIIEKLPEKPDGLEAISLYLKSIMIYRQACLDLEKSFAVLPTKTFNKNQNQFNHSNYDSGSYHAFISWIEQIWINIKTLEKNDTT